MSNRILSNARFLAQTLLVFCGYFFLAHETLIYNPTGSLAVFFWPSAGVALAGVILGGYRLAPAIAAAAFLVNFIHGAPFFAALVMALGNSLEALTGAYVARILGFNPLFRRLSDSLVFIAIALATALSAAVIGSTVLVVSGNLHEQAYALTLLTWWIGDALGILVVAPLLLRWFCRNFQLSERRPLDFVEYALLFFALAIISLLIFWEPIADLTSSPLLYLTFVPIAWGALRVGPRVLTLVTALTTAIAISGTLSGHGPFANLHASDIVLLQLYLGVMAMIGLIFVAIVEDRKDAIRASRLHIKELREDVEEMSEADRAKNEFIAILSHELRNPLAPVLSSLELLRLSGPKSRETTQTLDSMYDQILRITRLLDDLLDITRISRKKFNLEMRRVTIQDIVGHSITTSRETIKARGHTFSTDIAEDGIWLEADPLRLEQVFVNLLNNAAKYTPQGGTIAMSVQRKTSDGVAGVEIRVRDNGLGIAAPMLRAIFEPFRQVRPRDEGTMGLGIGLSLSKRFVELHSGTIEARSEGEGKGSEVIVWLPTIESNLLSQAVDAAPERVPHTLRTKDTRLILIVDDNRAGAEGIAKLLNHAGHDARVALDGDSAMRELENFRPDVIFLDIGLPNESGYDVAKKIRTYLQPPPYLVALTGYGQEEDKRRALENGFDWHLTKPVSIAGLEEVLTKSLHAS